MSGREGLRCTPLSRQKMGQFKVYGRQPAASCTPSQSLLPFVAHLEDGATPGRDPSAKVGGHTDGQGSRALPLFPHHLGSQKSV